MKGLKTSRVRPEVRLTDKELTGVDSPARVEFTMAVEEESGIQLPDEKVDSLVTFGDVVSSSTRSSPGSSPPGCSRGFLY